MKNILVIIDKLELKYFEFNNLVTNFWIIKELLERQEHVFITTISNLSLSGNIALTKCYETFTNDNNIFYKNVVLQKEIDSFDIVLFRPDPPVDIDYINATYIFDFVTKPHVINSPKSIRNFNEKLHSLYFSNYMESSIVTSSLREIENFLQKEQQIILKPLNKCFGTGVMYLYDGDPNTHTIINTVTNNETTLVMVQKYIPEVKHGDTRILTLGDKILPYSITKLPSKDDFKFNNHSDDYIIHSGLSKEDYNYFSPIAKNLNNMGIFMAGLDVIGKTVIEINVTSPCYFIKEINNLYKTRIEKEICDYILTKSLLTL